MGLVCCPNPGLELGFAPKEGAGEAVAENEGAADPKAGAPCPKTGVCPEPKPDEEAAEPKPNGEGLAAGAGAKNKYKFSLYIFTNRQDTITRYMFVN